MNAHGFDWLMGCLCGSIIIPWITRVVMNDGWRHAPKTKPPIDEEVLGWLPISRRYAAITYRGPAVDGDIPENSALYWRPMPPPPRTK